MASLVTISGQEKLNKQLEQLSAIGNIEQALDKVCYIVENDAKRNCPVDTGQLRQSITHEIVGEDAYVGTNVEYAPYIELGTGLFASAGNGRQSRWTYQTPDGQWHSTLGQQPQPFLHPALANNRKLILNTLQKELMQGVKNGR